MLLEQEALAEETRIFLKRWGLKGIYVSEVCEIHFKTFSRFLNHKVALSQPQMVRLKAYMHMETAANSAGTAEKKFSAYLESLGAKIESFNAAFESLSMNTFDAQFMGGLVDAATALIEFIDGINLLQAALVGLSAAGILKGFTMIASSAKNVYNDVLKLSTAFDIMGKAKGVGVTADQMQTLIAVTKGLSESQLRLVVSNKALTNEQRMAILTSSGLTKEQAAQTLSTMGLATAETTATAATFSLSGAMKALGAAIMANPIGFLATALTIAVSVIQTATDAAKEAKQALIESGKEAVQSAEDLSELINSYIELSYAVEDGTATQEELNSVQDDLIASLQDHGVAVQNLTGDYQSLRMAMIEAAQEALKTDISLAKASVNEMKQESVDELVTWFGDYSMTSASGDRVVEALKYLQELGYSGIGTGTEGGTIVLPNSATWDIADDVTFEEMVENYRYLENAMNDVRTKFGSENPVFESLSSMYTAYNDALKDDLEMIDSANELIAQFELMDLQLEGEPESLDEFKKFRSDLISATKSDVDFDPMGGKSAEEIVDTVLSQNSAYKDLLSELQKQEEVGGAIAQKRQDIVSEYVSNLKDIYMYDQEKYLEEQAEKRKSVDDIQAELDQLKYDDSAWAQKRKLELEEELASAQKDLTDFEKENALDQTMDLLDDLYEQQELLIQQEIDAIDKKLNDPAALYNQALNDIKNNTEELYDQMVEYNNKYGDGNPETVKEMWENAYVALKEYINLFGEAYKDIAIVNATDYKEPDDSWDTNPVSGTNPDNQTTQPTTPSTPKEEEKKSSAPSLEKGSTITVKKSATHFSAKSGSVRMASFVPGGKYTVYQTSGNEVLIGRDGVYTGWIKKTDIVGYASGTKYASAGFHRFDERGSEYIFSDQGGDKYRLFSSGEKVLDAESANFLYDFASKKGVGIVDKIIAGIFGSTDSIVDRIVGSAYGSKENLSRAVRSVTDNRVINNNVDMSGDINIQGNADEKTVSEIRREKRDAMKWILKEFNHMNSGT